MCHTNPETSYALLDKEVSVPIHSKYSKRIAAALFSIAMAGVLALAPAINSSAAPTSAAVAPSVAAHEASCPVGISAVVPAAASLKANGVKALIPAVASAAAATALSESPVLQRAVKQNARWVSTLGCFDTSAKSGTGVQRTSNNWSGYSWDGVDWNHQYYNQASSLWFVPTAQSGVITTQRHVSIWPGIGTGASKNDVLIQAGTETVAGPAGYQGTYGWFEAYPVQPTEVGLGQLPVNAGDQVGAIVTVNAANEAFFDLCNYTSNLCASAELDLSYNTSASNYGLIQAQTDEWIVERSGIPGGYSELGNFGAVEMHDSSGRQVPGNGIGSDLFNVSGLSQTGRTAHQIEMIGCNGSPLTQWPTTPDVNGSFIVPWNAYGSLENC